MKYYLTEFYQNGILFAGPMILAASQEDAEKRTNKMNLSGLSVIGRFENK